jgi:uncharacterized membrane protein
MWNLVLVHLKTVLVPVQDRCTVCAKTTIGSQVILYAPMVVLVTRPKWNLVLVHLEKVLILIQDRCTVCTEHNIGSEIILDASDGTPW